MYGGRLFVQLRNRRDRPPGVLDQGPQGLTERILLHGDTPGAVALGKSLRALVENAGWTVTPVSQLHK